MESYHREIVRNEIWQINNLPCNDDNGIADNKQQKFV